MSLSVSFDSHRWNWDSLVAEKLSVTGATVLVETLAKEKTAHQSSVSTDSEILDLLGAIETETSIRARELVGASELGKVLEAPTFDIWLVGAAADEVVLD